MNIESLNANRTDFLQKSKPVIDKKYNEDPMAARGAATAPQRSDVLQISDDAKKLQPVISRLSSGYYDKPEVMRDLAKQLANKFPPEIVGK